MIIGAGLGLVFSAAMATATFGVEPHDAGVASAMVNTTQQIGGSIGTALLSTHRGVGRHEPASRASPAGPTRRRSRARRSTATRPPSGGRRGSTPSARVICAALLTARSREAGLATSGEPALAHG